MMGDNDSTDLKVTNPQKQEQRVHNKCVERSRRDSEDTEKEKRARQKE